MLYRTPALAARFITASIPFFWEDFFHWDSIFYIDLMKGEIGPFFQIVQSV